MSAGDSTETSGESKTPSQPRLPSLNRVIWRWHFWAGLIAAPVLIVASVTGAIYIFQPEIARWLHPELLISTGTEPEATLQKIVDAAAAAAGPEWNPAILEIDNRFEDATQAIFFTNQAHQHMRLYVDPRGAKVLGELGEPNFLSVVLAIHRRLFVGTFGRILVELITCWTIILLLTGLWLWWPKKWKKCAGVFVPRLKSNRYTLARDSHAIPGTILFPIAIIIGITGLLYSYLWGTTFLLIGFTSGSFDIEVNPPQSVLPKEKATSANKLTVDDVMALAKSNELPTSRISIQLPIAETDSWSFKSGSIFGPSVSDVLFVDQYSGEVIQRSHLSELPLLAQWTQWNYPLHIGSILGSISKVIWLLACIVLCAMPITGIWMWLSRRRKGTTGFPKKYDRPLPLWMWSVICLLGVLMPVVGASLLLLGAVELSACCLRSKAD